MQALNVLLVDPPPTLPRCLSQLAAVAERVLEEEVQRVRLKHIHLANALKKLESTIMHKEQLAGAWRLRACGTWHPDSMTNYWLPAD